ncbi:MAG TPA: inositol monophosphatase family protein [Myxococcota bacterium]|jgi:myo-inositol-1(or 4)-monophosphatase|nr:inositol monophosphatase family protein [Myxococcota bacterium]HPC92075.1 inositol monophosphatase family protein [Myxococcota bacterium]HPL24293.1 inositol monophosphatase family protein [Myxococcota bacterium]HRR73342.1 inositol monophosphatase family protein [Myxococcota bacterium]HXK59646.1 inositol monophosphatase family protein [Acidobacteriota bacterium]
MTKELAANLEAAIVLAGRFIVTEAARIEVLPGTLPGEDNPHTNLDRETDALLHHTLLACFPVGRQPAYLTEELADDPIRLESDQVLIVDPIDGTRSLMKKHPEAAVSVALWRRGAGLVWGCVHNPFLPLTVSAIKGQGVLVNGRPSGVSNRSDPKECRLVMSRFETETGRLKALDGIADYYAQGSIANKMAHIACGLADATLTINPRSEWDLAAGTLLITEAGGIVTDQMGQALSFNQPILEMNGLVATNGHLHEWVLGLAEILRGANN